MKQSETPASRTIEAILAEVRSHVSAPQPLAIAPGGRREDLVAVPIVALSDRGETLPTGAPDYRIADFIRLDEESLLRNAYRVILGREMDPVGRADYLPALRSGRISPIAVLGSLRFSGEGRARGVKIAGLLPAVIADRLATIRVVGKLIAPFVAFAHLPGTTRSFAVRLATLDQRQDEMVSAINRSLGSVRRTLVQMDVLTRATEQGMLEARTTANSSVDMITGERVELAAARNMLGQQADRLAELAGAVRSGMPGTQAAQIAQTVAAGNLDSLYVAFENRFRGSTDEIGKRSERYLPILRQTAPVLAGAPVLDIGCGRGEWLSILANNNMARRGIDLNEAMADEARARGHEVATGDAIAYLQAQPAQSLAAVTAFHVVEHLPFATLVALFDAALRALKPGGVILFETPNPENLVVGACTFHYDPTHVRPLPPDVLRFLAEARGYGAARVIRTNQDCDLDQPESGFVPAEINDWFRQPPDYALYAQRPAS